MKVELVTSLKRQATKILADLHDTKEPVLITEHGKPSAYLVDVVASSTRFPPKELRKLEQLVVENKETFLEAWNDYFSS